MASSPSVSLFYRYIPFSNEEVEELVVKIAALGAELRLLGRCLVSIEGVNGSFGGPLHALLVFESALPSIHRAFTGVDFKYSSASTSTSFPFTSLSVRSEVSLISCGSRVPHNSIQRQIAFSETSYGGLEGTGVHLSPQDFHNELMKIKQSIEKGKEEEALVLDVRNIFESDIGQFEGATPLNTYTYSESWEAIDRRIKEFQEKKKERKRNSPSKILLYCTGGIRCEKASAYLKANAALLDTQIFQLEGGIHKYLDEFGASKESLFKGKNYVFDQRMALTHNKEKKKEEEEEEEVFKKEVVIGRCLDCGAEYDEYSETIVCTVCRYPLLVCTSCQESSRTKEYHCRRHRELKEVYFSQLGIFSSEELERQRDILLGMENDLKGDVRRKSKRKTLRLQRLRIENELIARCKDD